MKQFDTMRYVQRVGLHRATTIVELGFWDMVRLAFGREIEMVPYSEMIVIRSGSAYSAFNLDAGLGDPPRR